MEHEEQAVRFRGTWSARISNLPPGLDKLVLQLETVAVSCLGISLCSKWMNEGMKEGRKSQLMILWISLIWTWFVVEISKSKEPVRLKAVMQGGLLLFYQFFSSEAVNLFVGSVSGFITVARGPWQWRSSCGGDEKHWQRSQRSSSSLHFQSLNEHFCNNLQSRDGAKGKKCVRAAKMRWVGVGAWGVAVPLSHSSLSPASASWCAAASVSHTERKKTLTRSSSASLTQRRQTERGWKPEPNLKRSI